MTEFISNFHFLRPWYLLFLVLPFLLYLKKINFGKALSSWEDICDKNLLNFLLINNKNSKKISFKKYIYIGLISASVAMAGPSWKKVEVPVFEIQNPNMFVLSLAQDMGVTDVSPSRLDRAKFLILDIIKEIKRGQFGLEVYSTEPYIISPITDDAKLITNLLPQITLNIVPDQGDRLDRAIDLAIERFSSAGYMSGNIILFCADIGQRFDLALSAVEKAKKLNYTVNVVDVSFWGNEKLNLLANNGNGEYIKARTENISTLIEKISKINDEKTKISQNLKSSYEDFGYYLLFLPLVCVLVFFRKGLFILVFVLMSFDAFASAWLNNNQEGLKLYNEQKYDEALQKFDNPVWRSIVLYKQNKNDEALKELANNGDEIGLYNKGVILTKLCKYDEALRVFEEVIKKYPQNEDAKYNKKILDDLFSKAKENPSVLDCGQKQQNNQNNDQNNENKDENKDKNKEQNNNQQQNQNSENNDSESGNNQEQQSNEEQQAKADDNNKEDDVNKKDSKDENNTSSVDETKKDNNEKTKDDKGKDKEKNNSNKNGEENDDSDKSLENNNKSNNTDQNKDNNEKQNTDGEDIEEQDVSVANAKETDKQEDFDEEAMILQRRYREIPDDTGGLLGEFIKKEYLKDRYNNEKF